MRITWKTDATKAKRDLPISQNPGERVVSGEDLGLELIFYLY